MEDRRLPRIQPAQLRSRFREPRRSRLDRRFRLSRRAAHPAAVPLRDFAERDRVPARNAHRCRQRCDRAYCLHRQPERADQPFRRQLRLADQGGDRAARSGDDAVRRPLAPVCGAHGAPVGAQGVRARDRIRCRKRQVPADFGTRTRAAVRGDLRSGARQQHRRCGARLPDRVERDPVADLSRL